MGMLRWVGVTVSIGSLCLSACAATPTPIRLDLDRSRKWLVGGPPLTLADTYRCQSPPINRPQSIRDVSSSLEDDIAHSHNHLTTKEIDLTAWKPLGSAAAWFKVALRTPETHVLFKRAMTEQGGGLGVGYDVISEGIKSNESWTSLRLLIGQVVHSVELTSDALQCTCGNHLSEEATTRLYYGTLRYVVVDQYALDSSAEVDVGEVLKFSASSHDDLVQVVGTLHGEVAGGAQAAPASAAHSLLEALQSGDMEAVAGALSQAATGYAVVAVESERCEDLKEPGWKTTERSGAKQ
jgi:hypothetical protein